MGLRSFLLLTITIVPALCTQTNCTNENPCLVSCSGCTGLSMIPDPVICNQFYFCNENQLLTDTPFACPIGHEFNPETQKCELDMDGDGCTPICVTPPGECHYTCWPGDPLIPSAYNCNGYYLCDEDGTSGHLKTCPPEKPFFDGTMCQTKETHCCHCHGYCFPGEEGRLVVDPVDCRKYYVCLAEGAPHYSGTCDSGENFDPISRKCSKEAPCLTMCPNVIGFDGCIEPYMCQKYGKVAKCPGQCKPEYYDCDGYSNEYATVKTCSNGQVFDEENNWCTSASNCTPE